MQSETVSSPGSNEASTQPTPGGKSKLSRKYRRPGLTAAGTIPDALTNFSALPDDARVAIPVLEGLTGGSNATMHRRMKDDPDFPRAIRDGRCTRFRVGDIRRYLAKKAG